MNARHLLTVCGTFLLLMACKAPSKQNSENPECQYVIALKADISVKDSPNGKQIAFANRGEMFCLTDSAQGWYKIRLQSGKEGYINADSSQTVAHDSIPKEAFEQMYTPVERKVQFGYMTFKRDGNNIMAQRDYNSVPADGNLWNSVHQGSTVYYGTIEGNRLVFNRELSRFMLEMDEIDLSEMTEIEPLSMYYSPVEEGFIFEGGLFREINFNTSSQTEEMEEKPHPLSARKGLGLYGNVESVTDNEGKTTRFDRIGNILTINKGKSRITYHYNAERTEYNVDDFGPYVITYGDHKRSDKKEDFDSEGSVEYFFDEHDRIIQRITQVRMSFLTENFTYTGENLLPDSMYTKDYDEAGTYLTTEKYDYLKVDEQGNWLKRKVTTTHKVTEHVEGGEDIVETETEPDRIETQTITYFN